MTLRETKDITDLKRLLFDQKNKIIAIAGLSKNAGKTSFLNYLIQHCPQNFSLAVTTTGHDGEDNDFLTGLKKPKLLLKKNTYFTSLSNNFLELNSSVKIIKRLPMQVLSKNLYLLQALDYLETEIYGPHTVEQQLKLCSILQDFGINKIIIDGSLDRKSIALSPKIDHLLLIASPAFGNFNQILTELDRLIQFTHLSVFKQNMLDLDDCISIFKNNQLIKTSFKTIFKHEKDLLDLCSEDVELIYFPGALTDNSFNKIKNCLLNFSGQIIFKHPLQIMLSATNFKLLTQKNILVLNPFTIEALGLNSFSVDQNHLNCEDFRFKLRQLFSDIKIVDIQELLINKKPKKA